MLRRNFTQQKQCIQALMKPLGKTYRYRDGTLATRRISGVQKPIPPSILGCLNQIACISTGKTIVPLKRPLLPVPVEHLKQTDKNFFSCMLVQEDNLFDMFPAAELHPTVDFMNKQSKLKIPDDDESCEFMFHTDILKEISDPGVQLQKGVSHPMDTESHFPCIYGAGGFRFEKDTQFPDFSSPRKDNVDQLRAETAQAEDSAGKKSLSLVNSGTAVDADCKRNCSKNEESNGENKEQFEEPTNRDPPSETEETPAPMEEASTQPTIYMQDKVDHCNDNSPVPSQIKSKEPMEEKWRLKIYFRAREVVARTLLTR